MRSLRARLALIFLLLILLAMQLISWYVEQSLENYYLGNHTRNVERQARLMVSFLERYLAEDVPQEYIANYLRDYGRESGLDLLYLDADAAVMAVSSGMESLLGSQIVLPEVDQALSEGEPSRQIRDREDNRDPVLSLAMPVLDGGRPAGVLYLNASLGGVYQTLHDIRSILLGATVLALVVTAGVAFILAGTITRPIRAITEKARQMASGNFDERIEVSSRDEIGELGSMFNYMAERLRHTLADVSEEKRRLEVVLGNMADGVVALDAGGRVMLANPRAGEILNEDPPEMPGQSIRDLLPGVALKSPIEETMNSGDDITLRFQLEDSNRVIRAHLAAILPEGEGDVPRGMVMVLQDVTEQEQAEQRRKEFVANVSHELKTPLTTVKSYMETLLEGAIHDDRVSEQFMQVVLDETDRMTRMVRDLLDLSLIDSDEMTWEEDRFSLPELVDRACGNLAPRADARGVSLGYRGSPDLPLLHGDRDRIEQVLVNLITNAVEYTPEGGQVRVSWRRRGDRVYVAVSDDGVGIPEEDLPRIFERFYRVDKARSRASGGTGLGLAIAREIIESHRGKIWAQSTEGEGTTIELYLPLNGKGDQVDE
ncbi:MAG: ATP-binding protein [Bacillota bacterium]